MSKLKLGVGAAVLAGVATIAGGHMYADGKLKDHYSKAQTEPGTVKFTYQNYDMGLFSGKADWTATIQLDPCQPSQVLVLKGSDKISRSWNGYAIDSDFEFKDGLEPLQKVFNKPLHAESKLNFLGNMSTKIATPVIAQNADGVKVDVEPIKIQFKGKNQQDKMNLTELEMHLPKMTVVEGANNFSLQGLKLDVDQNMGSYKIEEGKSKLEVDLVKFGSADVNGELKDLDFNSETKLHDKTVSFLSSFNFGSLSTGSGAPIEKFKMNFEVNDVNREKLQTIFDYFEKSSKTCVAEKNLKEQAVPQLLALLNDGLSIKSMDNQLKIGKGEAKFDLAGNLKKSNFTDFQSLMQTLPLMLEYKANFNFDKDVVKGLMALAPAGRQQQLSDADLDKVLNEFVSSGKVNRKGDDFSVNLSYKDGKQEFLKEAVKF